MSNVCAVKGYFLIFFTFMTGGSVVYEPSFEGTGQAGYTISVSFGFFIHFSTFITMMMQKDVSSYNTIFYFKYKPPLKRGKRGRHFLIEVLLSVSCFIAKTDSKIPGKKYYQLFHEVSLLF